jgi:hypothetical protein
VAGNSISDVTANQSDLLSSMILAVGFLHGDGRCKLGERCLSTLNCGRIRFVHSFLRARNSRGWVALTPADDLAASSNALLWAVLEMAPTFLTQLLS